MNEARFGLVIVAGGQGTRMGGDVPKPFIKLQGKEVILHTLEAFAGLDWIVERVLVLPKAIIRELFGPAKQRNFPSADHQNPTVQAFAALGVCECVCGGDRRQDSVLRGAKALSEDVPFLMIHDAVRPFVQPSEIEALREAICSQPDGAAATLSTPVTDSLRYRESDAPIDRDQLVAVQTPQGGPRSVLIRGLEEAGETTFTDDFSLFAAQGAPLLLVNASKSNIKLTTPEDLAYADYMLAKADARGHA